MTDETDSRRAPGPGLTELAVPKDGEVRILFVSPRPCRDGQPGSPSVDVGETPRGELQQVPLWTTGLRGWGEGLERWSRGIDQLEDVFRTEGLQSSSKLGTYQVTRSPERERAGRKVSKFSVGD
jgi:hypothetical protein